MADERTVYLTEEGYKEAQERLNYLQNVESPAVVERIKIAKEQGDLSENAEYHAAREEQGKIEGEIAELTATLKYAKIIQKGASDKISMGSKIKIKDLSFNEVETYFIVGSSEVDVKLGKISNESALGAALIGAKKGDVVTVLAPNGSYKVEVLEIE